MIGINRDRDRMAVRESEFIIEKSRKRKKTKKKEREEREERERENNFRVFWGIKILK
jgi:hypothetical protein